ncbi:MAG: hypothetical protein IJD48_04305 [Clostridia bacterium]|nr:hypothetical protein [Clostridia bacterium]
MNNEEKSGFIQLLDLVGKITAILMILCWAVTIAEAYIKFLPTDGIIPTLIAYVDMYAPITLMVIVGLEAVWDKPLLVKLLVILACAAIVICSFFPDVRATIENYAGLTQLAK